MAFVKTAQNKDEEDLSNIDTTGGATSVLAPKTGSTPVGGVAPQAPSSSSGGWTNIQSYLESNKPQAAELGQTVANTIDKQTEEARAAIGAGSEAFKNQVDQNRLNYDANAVQGTINTGNADDQTLRQLGGTYVGPKGLSDAGLAESINAEVAKASQKAALVGDVGGRTELLRQASADPQTGGNLKLNQLFLQNDETATNALKGAADRAVPLTAEQQAAQTLADQQAAQAAAEAQAIGLRTNTDITNYLGSQATERQQRLANEKARLEKEQQAAKAYLQQLAGIGGETQKAQLTQQVRDAEGNLLEPAAVEALKHLDANGLPTGWEAAGLTQEQAMNLADDIYQAKQLGLPAPDVTGYYTGADLSGLNVSNVTTQEEADRINRLAALVNQAKITAGNKFGNSGSFNSAGIIGDLAGKIQTGVNQRDSAYQNAKQFYETEKLQKQMAEDQAKALKKADPMNQIADLTEDITKGSWSVTKNLGIGMILGGGPGAAIGAIIGGKKCFEENTEVVMKDGTTKVIKDIKIGDEVLLGGMVTAAGRALVDDLYEYHGLFMSATHVLYYEDEKHGNRWVTVAEVGNPVKLQVPVIVCPLVTEHNLIVAGDFISADMMVVPNSVDPRWNMNHDQRMDYINGWTERNAQLEQLINLRKQKVEEILCSM
jgi:hypothetical protein